MVLLDTKNLNVIYKIENFWNLGVTPRFLCCSLTGKYVIGLAESHRNKHLTLAWKEESSLAYNVKKMELNSKEIWVGMDLNCGESGLMVCSLVDSRAAKMRGVNSEVYPMALVLALHDYKSQNFGTLGWQEFFDNRFLQASIMRRHSACDIFMVGGVGAVGIFHLEGTSNFSLLSVLTGFGEYSLSDIYFEEKILLLVRQHPDLHYPIVYYDLRDEGKLDDDSSLSKDERETEIEEYKKVYLQPNIKYHPIQKFKDEVKKYHTNLQCSEGPTEDLVTVANVAGVSHMIKREGGNLIEAAVSSQGS